MLPHNSQRTTVTSDATDTGDSQTPNHKTPRKPKRNGVLRRLRLGLGQSKQKRQDKNQDAKFKLTWCLNFLSSCVLVMICIVDLKGLMRIDLAHSRLSLFPFKPPHTGPQCASDEEVLTPLQNRESSLSRETVGASTPIPFAIFLARSQNDQ